MMQSSPLNLRRAIIWIGRLFLGGIFIYAGYSKAFLPNHTLWPLFFLKFSISTNLANFALQVEAFKFCRPGESNSSRTLSHLRRLSSGSSC